MARRLVIVDHDVAEVAHEALLRDWPRLVAWLDEDRIGRRVHERLTTSAAVWAEGGREPGELARGTRLDSIVEWSRDHLDDLTLLERDYVDASRAEANCELEEARTRVAFETRRTRRLRTSLVGIAVLLVVALAAGGVAIQQGSNAQESESHADLAARLRDASRLAAISRTLPALDYQERLRTAVEAYRLAPGPDTEGALESALVAVPGDRSSTVTFDGGSPLGGITPDGARIVVAGAIGPTGLTVVDAATSEVIDRIPLPDERARAAVEVSGDGRWAAVGSLSSAHDCRGPPVWAGRCRAAAEQRDARRQVRSDRPPAPVRRRAGRACPALGSHAPGEPDVARTRHRRPCLSRERPDLPRRLPGRLAPARRRQQHQSGHDLESERRRRRTDGCDDRHRARRVRRDQW